MKWQEVKVAAERESGGLLLLIFAFVILQEAIGRLHLPMQIHFKEVILVAYIGLAGNIVSTILMLS